MWSHPDSSKPVTKARNGGVRIGDHERLRSRKARFIVTGLSSVLFNFDESCYYYTASVPIPVAARAKAWVCSRSRAGVAGSIPARAWMFVSCGC
jgi:hypothetical protein